MTLRDELTILQKALQKSIDLGFLQDSQQSFLGVDISLDPPSIIIRKSSPVYDDSNLYFDPLFPLIDAEWAYYFWGIEMMPSQSYIVLPAWKYHQHRLLEFVQNGEREEFSKYIEVFL